MSGTSQAGSFAHTHLCLWAGSPGTTTNIPHDTEKLDINGRPYQSGAQQQRGWKKKATQKTDSSENWCWSVLEALYGGLKLAKSEVNKWIYSKIKSDIKCIKSIIENK